MTFPGSSRKRTGARLKSFRGGGTFKSTDISVELIVPIDGLRLDLEAARRLGDIVHAASQNFGEAVTKNHGDNGKITRIEKISVTLFNGRTADLVIRSNSNMTWVQLRRLGMSMIGVPAEKVIHLAQDRNIVRQWVLDRAARRAQLDALELESPLNAWVAEQLAERARRSGLDTVPREKEWKQICDELALEISFDDLSLLFELPVGSVEDIALAIGHFDPDELETETPASARLFDSPVLHCLED